ncbi:MAG TPA: hypothetical protein PK878_01750, partial [bacterium]|nr:hypothetical protein [bacterium]
EERKTIFFCSHILADIEMLCDRIAILNKGELIKLGTVREILSSQSPDYIISLEGLSEAALEEIKGMNIKKYEVIGGFHHFTAPSQEDAQRIAQRAMADQGRIIELRPERGTLEDYFIREVGTRE